MEQLLLDIKKLEKKIKSTRNIIKNKRNKKKSWYWAKIQYIRKLQRHLRRLKQCLIYIKNFNGK